MAELSLRQLLEGMVQRRASDLHLTAGVPPEMRIDGPITRTEYEVLTPEKCIALAYSVLSDEQRKTFETTKELDFSFGVKGLSRFRANVFLQRGVVSLVIRQIPYAIPPVEGLGLPPALHEMARQHKGLFLVTGPTGSGKSTTLASLLDRMNDTRQAHIITIEDPIEYTHHHKTCIVNPREIAADTRTIPKAPKHPPPQDPDTILTGALRDL